RSIDRLYDRLAELQEQQASVRWPTMVWEDRPTVGEALRRLRSLGYTSEEAAQMILAREERLQLEDAARAISALLYVRRHVREREKRAALTRAARGIAMEALASAQSGEFRRERFAQLRRQAEELEEGVRLVRERMRSEPMRLPGRRRDAMAEPVGRY